MFTNNADTSLWQTPVIAIKKFVSTLLWLRNFTEANDPSWLGIFWAVSLELQTFVIVAIIYFMVGRKYVLYLSIFFIILMMFYRFGGDMAWLFRFDPILYGVVLYDLIKKLDKDKLNSYFTKNCLFKSIISLALIISLSSTLKVFSNYPNFNISISSLIASTMLFLALSDNGYFYCNIKPINYITEWLASRSYSLYCSHIISWFSIKQLYMAIDKPYNTTSFIISIIVMVIFAELSYKFIERN